MRELILTILIPSVMIWGLTGPGRAVLMLTWICFQRPQSFSLGIWAHLPVFEIAFAITLLSAIIHRDMRPRINAVLVIQMALLLWVTVCAMAAFNAAHAWLFYSVYVPAMWAMPLVLCAATKDVEHLKRVVWIAAGSIALTGCKVGAVLAAGGGSHITDQLSGFVGDNNVFGLVLCVVVSITLGMRRTLPDKRWVLVLFFVVVCLNILVIVYTKSRGALLTLGLIALCASLTSGRPVRALTLLLIAVVVGYWLIPAEYFDRLQTLNDVTSDTSAMGRVENWGLSWHEALRFPVFGVGPDNHMLYNAAIGSDVRLRVAHSVYFETLGELGFPGLILYVLLMVAAISSSMKTWRMMIPVVKQHPDLIWVRDVAYWMTWAFLGYAFGSGLLNMLYIEFPWDAFLLSGLLFTLARGEIAKRARVSGRPGRAEDLRERSAHAYGAVRGSWIHRLSAKRVGAGTPDDDGAKSKRDLVQHVRPRSEVK